MSAGNIHKVNYTYLNREYGPYLRVFFYSPLESKKSPETLAILDSGSNRIIMPFSMGRTIKLKHPESLGEFDNMYGVGGSVPFVDRPCIIYLVDNECGEIYGFWVNVDWEHPRELDIKKIEKMSAEELDRFEKQGVILGRDFLNNFRYVKFHQRRNRGHFLYKIKESKIDRIAKYPDDINKLISDFKK